MSDFRIGKFQIIGTLGTGAHSTILQVRRAEDSKTYALKVEPQRDLRNLGWELLNFNAVKLVNVDANQPVNINA